MATKRTKRFLSVSALTMVVAILALITRAGPALAGKAAIAPLVTGNCLQDIYSLSAKQKLSCTANDVRIAAVANVRHLDGTAFPACNLGESVSFLADFLVVTNSKSTRSNIGLYFGTAAQGTALTGACTDSIVAPQHRSGPSYLNSFP
jgi:hypothetical protein